MPHAYVSLNLENQDLDRWNLHSMLKISHAACPCRSVVISVQFALEMGLAARNCQKIHKNPNREPVYDFLLAINSNLGHISHCFWHMVTYLLKTTNFLYPLSFRAPAWGDPFKINGNVLRILKLLFQAAKLKIWWS